MKVEDISNEELIDYILDYFDPYIVDVATNFGVNKEALLKEIAEIKQELERRGIKQGGPLAYLLTNRLHHIRAIDTIH